MRAVLLALALCASVHGQTLTNPARPLTVVDRGLVPTSFDPGIVASNTTAINVGMANAFTSKYPIYIPCGKFYVNSLATPGKTGGVIVGEGGTGQWGAGATLSEGASTDLIYADTTQYTQPHLFDPEGAGDYDAETNATGHKEPLFEIKTSGTVFGDMRLFGRTPTEFPVAGTLYDDVIDNGPSGNSPTYIEPQADVGLRIASLSGGTAEGKTNIANLYVRHFNVGVQLGYEGEDNGDLPYIGRLWGQDCDTLFQVHNLVSQEAHIGFMHAHQCRVMCHIYKGGAIYIDGGNTLAQGGSVLVVSTGIGFGVASLAPQVHIQNWHSDQLGTWGATGAPRFKYMLFDSLNEDGEVVPGASFANVTYRNCHLPANHNVYGGWDSVNGIPGPIVNMTSEQSIVLDRCTGINKGVFRAQPHGVNHPRAVVTNCVLENGVTPENLIADGDYNDDGMPDANAVISAPFPMYFANNTYWQSESQVPYNSDFFNWFSNRAWTASNGKPTCHIIPSLDSAGSGVMLKDMWDDATTLCHLQDLFPDAVVSDTIKLRIEFSKAMDTVQTAIDLRDWAGSNASRLWVDITAGACDAQGQAVSSGTAANTITVTELGSVWRVEATFTAPSSNPTLIIRPAIRDADGSANETTGDATATGKTIITNIEVIP